MKLNISDVNLKFSWFSEIAFGQARWIKPERPVFGNHPKVQLEDSQAIHSIINDASKAYKGAIPSDCWMERCVPKEELLRE